MTAPHHAPDGPLTLECSGDVATLRLRRPLRRNSSGDDHLAAIGAVPAVRLPLLAAAMRAFLAGRALSVDALDRPGLFEAVVPAAGFDAAVDDLVRRVAALAPLAAATKRSLDEIAAGCFDRAVLRGREVLTQAGADFAEGRAAFAERRPPRFTGR